VLFRLKEQHLLHFIYAAVAFPLIANPFQQNKIIKDSIASAIAVLALILTGFAFPVTLGD
jgi:hypothetical protein